MSDIIYGIDAKKNLMTVSENKSFIVGDITTINGIEVYCIRAGAANVTLSGMGAVDDTPPIFVDKNHDLSYYISGSDFLNTSEESSVISNTAKYGYEWGGYNTTTGITNTEVGTGLSNTGALIAMNLQPNTSGWNVLWNKVQDFRTGYGHNWFVPSKDEVGLVYQQKANLTNITDSDNQFNNSYWSSSEYSSNYAWYQPFISGNRGYNNKGYHYYRVRLCYMPQ